MNFGRCAAQKFLVDFRKLASDDDGPRTEDGRDIVQSVQNPMGRFVEDQRGAFPFPFF